MKMLAHILLTYNLTITPVKRNFKLCYKTHQISLSLATVIMQKKISKIRQNMHLL